MYFYNTQEINQKLKITKKAIIGLGCSFVDGQGAIDQDIYDRYEWSFIKNKGCMVPNINYDEICQLIKEKPILRLNEGLINWNVMERKNAFIDVLCNKYFQGKYTPINLGLRGQGNRAAIKSLYFLPKIDWNSLEEVIVIYMPSGPERFDLINDEFTQRFFLTIWPFYDKLTGPKKTLSKGYQEAVYSEKFALLEQIINIIDLENWCKVNRAKLIVTPAFDESYTKDKFGFILHNDIKRNKDRKINYFSDDNNSRLQSDCGANKTENLENMIDMWPWDKMFYPQEAKTFLKLCLKQENITNNDYSVFYGAGTAEKWISLCGHPSAKGHELFAKELFGYLLRQ